MVNIYNVDYNCDVIFQPFCYIYVKVCYYLNNLDTFQCWVQQYTYHKCLTTNGLDNTGQHNLGWNICSNLLFLNEKMVLIPKTRFIFALKRAFKRYSYYWEFPILSWVGVALDPCNYLSFDKKYIVSLWVFLDTSSNWVGNMWTNVFHFNVSYPPFTAEKWAKIYFFLWSNE